MGIKSTLLALLLVSAPSAASAEPRLALNNPDARRVADWVSYGTSITPVALDAIGCRADVRCYGMLGARIGVTYGAVFAIKALVHRQRPCAPGCGIDNPDFSFYSAHTALAFTAVGGPRLAITLPFAVSTGGLRVAAGKHWATDTLVGAGAGLLASRLR